VNVQPRELNPPERGGSGTGGGPAESAESDPASDAESAPESAETSAVASASASAPASKEASVVTGLSEPSELPASDGAALESELETPQA
jgi:hypothetical protein